MLQKSWKRIFFQFQFQDSVTCDPHGCSKKKFQDSVSHTDGTAWAQESFRKVMLYHWAEFGSIFSTLELAIWSWKQPLCYKMTNLAQMKQPFLSHSPYWFIFFIFYNPRWIIQIIVSGSILPHDTRGNENIWKDLAVDPGHLDLQATALATWSRLLLVAFTM